MRDLLFKTEDGVFSYRAAGVCIHNGRVLLQYTTDDPSLAFPGGHVAFGETAEDALARELVEETGARIEVRGVRWTAELFIPWGIPSGGRMCHQICLFYDVKIVGGIPMSGSFIGREKLEGREFDLIFQWVPIEKLGGDGFAVYPTQCAELLKRGAREPVHFIYRE